MINLTILILLLFFISCSKNDNTESLEFIRDFHGQYLGQKPPGMTPEVFAPGIISGVEAVLNAAFSPDGNAFYYSSISDSGQYTVKYSYSIDGNWTIPETAPFSGEFNDADPIFSYDGRYLFFVSDRPETSNDKETDLNVWYIERSGKKWTEPVNAGGNVNTEVSEFYPAVSGDMTLYFTAEYENGYGRRDIYRSEFANGVYSEPENIGETINTEYDESDVFVSPGEEYIIYKVSGRPDSYGYGDIFISFKDENNNWAEGINMGRIINTAAHEYCPIMSPDMKYFFFTRVINGRGHIYWIDAKVIDGLKPDKIR